MRAELGISHSSKQGQNMTEQKEQLLQSKVTGWGCLLGLDLLYVEYMYVCIGCFVQCYIWTFVIIA